MECEAKGKERARAGNGFRKRLEMNEVKGIGRRSSIESSRRISRRSRSSSRNNRGSSHP